MRLFTCHEPHFDIVNHPVNLELSGNYSDEHMQFNVAYDWLIDFLGIRRDFLWFYDKDDIIDFYHSQEVVTWVVDIPDDNPFYRINSDVWNCILSRWHYIPDSAFEGIDEKDHDRIFDEWYSKYDMITTWRRYLLDTSSGLIEYLVEQPIKPEWVVEKRWFSWYEVNMIQDCEGIIRRGFSSKRENEKFVEAIISLLNGRKVNYSKDWSDRYCEFTWD